VRGFDGTFPATKKTRMDQASIPVWDIGFDCVIRDPRNRVFGGG
jgi:hypothetical protein